MSQTHFYALNLIFLSLGFDSCVITSSLNGSNELIVHTNICGDHGKCISEPFSDFSCVCDPGYTGRYCHESTYL